MNIKKTLTAIKLHFDTHRGVGHTTTMLKGVENCGPCIVMAVDKSHQMVLRRIVPQSCVLKSIGDNLDSAPNLPLVMDNWSLYELCHQALIKIQSLEKEINQLGKSIGKNTLP